MAVRTATGQWIRKRVVAFGGRDFPCWNVVWEDDRHTEWVPWPIEDVRPLAEHPDALSRDEYRAVAA